MAEPAFAVPSDLMDSGSAPCDLGFMEVIGQKMRIPNRLKVTEEQGDEDKVEDIPLSTLQMQIPERISMGETEMQDIGARPYLYGWFHNNPSITDPPPLSISPNLMFGATHALNVDRPESPLQMATSQHSSRPRTLSENEICLASVSRRQRNLSRFHSQPLSSSLYLDGTNQTRNQSMTHEYTIPEGVLENFSVMEIVTLRRQLNKLNRRLQLLEQESRDHARKEFVLYSIIIAACFVNSWLWLRK
ncbi:mitochondrial fission factor-like isoform X1 [Scyliorhinus canicula]|uniref:mitochondrial fission factor-like isoform X1 n=1 Tax=Scyliorhinus canicula TaxID=7830 RepID=UPI0018F6EDD6|nr:mitochondrial fission factor-like isoform X1 [Scyliorhinus canicula]XP_038631407.1 mitochondrial fission factor-like isoform X1 [Scyliorhinus canicula]XP_038631408.1 mitochondrial fission factor-like isoform X1 [Scyliorhinus canicula]